MDDVNIRLAVATDLPRLMGLDHTSTSDYVWQLDLRKENGQVIVPLPLSHAIPFISGESGEKSVSHFAPVAVFVRTGLTSSSLMKDCHVVTSIVPVMASTGCG